MQPRGQGLPTVHVNWVSKDGGVGDQIGRVVPVRYVLETWKHVSIHLIIPDYFEEFAQHVFADLVKTGRLFIKPLSRAASSPASFNRNIPTYVWDDQDHSALKTHTVDHAFHMLADIGNYPKSARSYPRIRPSEIDISHFGLPEKFVVLTTGHTAITKEWPVREVNKTADWLINEGYKPVFLGKAQVESVQAKFDPGINTRDCIDLREKTSLLEAASVMAKAKAVCGVDNALLHYAASTDTPIVAGFTFVSPETRAPLPQNPVQVDFVLPDPSLSCRFCQEKYHYLYSHDFRKCYHGDLACVSQMTAGKFIGLLKRILK